MKIAQYSNVRMFAVAVSLAVAIMGCGSEDSISTAGSRPAVNAQSSPTATPPAISRSEDGTTYVRMDGWPILSFNGAERKELETSIPSNDGRSVKVDRTVIEPPLLFIGNPLQFIGMRSKDILIHKVKEYRTSAGIFCYKFLVNDAEFDEITKELRSTRGLLYTYMFYDEDGDSVFESLVIDEKDRNGRSGFESEPHLPKWSLK